jgi:hypothetical protein
MAPIKFSLQFFFLSIINLIILITTQMHFHQKSANQLSNSIKALLLILITYTSTCNAISEAEIAETLANFDMNTPGKYCGRRLTDAMKVFCNPHMRAAIAAADNDDNPKKEKKSCEYLNFYFFVIKNLFFNLFSSGSIGNGFRSVFG